MFLSTAVLHTAVYDATRAFCTQSPLKENHNNSANFLQVKRKSAQPWIATH